MGLETIIPHSFLLPIDLLVTSFESAIILIFAAGSNILIGLLIFMANPDRAINRTFGIGSILPTLWVASQGGLNYSEANDSIFWIRNMIGIGGFIPFAVSVLKESIIKPNIRFGEVLKLAAVYLFLGLFNLAMVWTPWFSHPEGTSAAPNFGWAFYIHLIYLPITLVYLGISTYMFSRTARGIVKLDLQVFVGTGCVFTTLGLLMTSPSAFVEMDEIRNLSPIAVVGFYGLIAYTMTNRKIFEPEQLLKTFIKYALIYLLGITLFLLIRELFLTAFSTGTSQIIALVACLSAAYSGNDLIDRLLSRFAAKERTTNERALNRVYDLGKEHIEEETIKSRFQDIIVEWAGTEKVALFMPHDDNLEFENISLSQQSMEVLHLVQHDWESYESLERVREAGAVKGLKEFMNEHDFQMLTIVVGDKEKNIAFMLGLGRRNSRYPYTYQHSRQLKLLCEAFRPLLEHSQIAKQVRNSEQLASVGLLAASLAHEIRNPLVAIKTFFQLLPVKYKDESFRTEFSSIIQEEVQRIENLSQNLLDSSKPSVGIKASVSLSQIGSAAVELVNSKARQQGIEIVRDITVDNDTVLADTSSMRQVMLNILLNAIDAIEEDQSSKKIQLKVYRKQNMNWIEVEDNGKGMPEEVKKSIFKPFYSTKTHGFGLGLTVSAEILKEHNATIRIDSSPGQGTRFAIGFEPCPEYS